MTAAERLIEIAWRVLDLDRQLRERAKLLFELLGDKELSEEFTRLRDIEVRPILRLANSVETDGGG